MRLVNSFRLDRQPAGAHQDEKSLGRKATDQEMASLTTWMKVEETEQREEERADPSPATESLTAGPDLGI